MSKSGKGVGFPCTLNRNPPYKGGNGSECLTLYP